MMKQNLKLIIQSKYKYFYFPGKPFLTLALALLYTKINISM